MELQAGQHHAGEFELTLAARLPHRTRLLGLQELIWKDTTLLGIPIKTWDMRWLEMLDTADMGKVRCLR